MTAAVHACPVDSGLTPCCRKTPFELPHTDRMTADPALVTCMTGSDPRLAPTTTTEGDRA